MHHCSGMAGCSWWPSKQSKAGLLLVAIVAVVVVIVSSFEFWPALISAQMVVLAKRMCNQAPCLKLSSLHEASNLYKHAMVALWLIRKLIVSCLLSYQVGVAQPELLDARRIKSGDSGGGWPSKHTLE